MRNKLDANGFFAIRLDVPRRLATASLRNKLDANGFFAIRLDVPRRLATASLRIKLDANGFFCHSPGCAWWVRQTHNRQRQLNTPEQVWHTERHAALANLTRMSLSHSPGCAS
ncbi:MAG: hypothetical protein BKP49_05625 [Treponema sp. CETP13]|nr:MAG: hypothetical protein BKP49_05625 [Treponema sp. CETP13]